MAFLPHDAEANTLLPPLNNTFIDYNSNSHHLHHHHQQQHPQQQQSGLINGSNSGFASPVFTDFESQLSHEIHGKDAWQNSMDAKQHLKLQQPKIPFGGITDFTSYQSFVDMAAPSWDAKLMLPSSSGHESLDAISVSDIWGCHGDVKEPSPTMPSSSSSQPFSDISKMFNSNWGGLSSSITLPVDPSKGFLEGNDLHSCSPVMSSNLEFSDQRQASKFGDFSKAQFNESLQMPTGDANGSRIAPRLCDLGSVHSSPNGSNFAGLQDANKQAKQAIAAAATTTTPVAKDGSLNRKRTMSSTIVDADTANESDGSMGQEVSSNAGSESASHGDKPGKKRRTKNVCKDGGPQISYPKDSEANDMKGLSNKGGDNNDETKLRTEQPTGSVNSGDSMPKPAMDNSKPPEPSKPDYIHVRARRGQATDSHSLAERVRREKISERMKFLQDLVPGCSKVTGKAVMLDEIINYVQSLQRQVEFLSMKLAAVNPRVDSSIDGLFGRDMFGPRVPQQQPLLFPTDNGTSSFPSLHQQLPPQLQPPPMQGVGSCPPLDVHTLGAPDMSRHAMNSSLPSIDNYGDSVSQVQRLLTSFLNAKTRSSGC